MAITKIGPQIGIEGEKEYRRALREIQAETKNWEAEIKLLNATFDKNNDYLDQNKKLQTAIKAEMDSVSRTISTQQNELEKLVSEHIRLSRDGGVGVKDFDKKYQELSATIKDNQVIFSNLENQLEQTKLEEQEFIAVTDTLNDAFKNVDPTPLREMLKNIGEDMARIGSSMTLKITKPIINGFKSSVNAAIDWESNLTSVLKTVDLVDESTGQLIMTQDELSKNLRQIGHRTMATYDQIAGVAEVAGQLGVATEDVVDFTEVMIKLGDSTNLSAEEAATNIARILNITKGGNYNTNDVKRFGSAIVDLGNHFATTESEIALMANRLAAGGTIAHLTTADILGLATAMSSVGIRAEAGGTAMTQTLTAIEKAVSNVGENASDKLEKMAKIAGMSAKEFSNAWKTEPQVALTKFLKGLGNLEEKGESATLVLDELGMSGIRQSNMLKSLSLASDILTNAVSRSNNAWDGTRNYLDEEAQKRYDTVASKIQQMKNAWQDFAIVVGERLMPLFDKVIEWLEKAAVWLTDLDPKWIDFGIAIAGVVASIGPLLMVGGSLLKFAADLAPLITLLKGAEGFTGLSTAISGATTTLGAVGGTTGLVGGLEGLIGILAGTGGVIALIAGTAGLVAAITLAIGAMNDWAPVSKQTSEEIKNDWDNAAKSLLEKWGYTEDEIKKLTNDTTNYVKTKEEATFEYLQLLGNDEIRYAREVNRAVTEEARLAKQHVLFNVDDTYAGFTKTTSGLVSQTQTDFKNIEESMVNNVESAKKSIADKKQPLANTMREVVDTSVKEISYASGQAYSYGADLVSSMESGVNSRKWSLQNAISSLANTIRSYLHFSEPDVGPLSDFHTYMPDMMKEMARGITNNAYLVENAVDGVAQSMAFGRNISPFGTSANSYNYGGFVINLNVNGNANGQQLVDEIEQELARRMNNRKAVFNQ